MAGPVACAQSGSCSRLQLDEAYGSVGLTVKGAELKGGAEEGGLGAVQ